MLCPIVQDDKELRKRSKHDGSTESFVALLSDSSSSDAEDPGLAKLGACPISCRHVLAILGFWGFVNVYTMRTNLSVVIVAMTKNSSSNLSGICVNNTRSDGMLFPLRNDIHYGNNDFDEFDWDEHTQGIVLGSFFWGYLVSQIPGGIISQRYSAKWIYCIGCLITALFTLLTPLAARTSVNFLIAVRVIEGLGEGVTFPAMHSLLAKWTPPWERSKMAAFVYSGTSIGTVISLILSGVLCQSSLFGGWPSAFYVFGVATIVWSFFWITLVYDSPSVHPLICTEEQIFINNSLHYVERREIMKIPWYEIFFSFPVWGIVLAHMGSNWGFYTLLTELPTYMHNILGFSIKKNGILSSIPYFVFWITAVCTSWTADRLIVKGILRTIIPALALLGISWAQCDSLAVISLLCVAMGFHGASYSGHAANHIDIASNYAGILMGLTNTMATLTGIFAPYFVGYMTNKEQTLENWNKVFYTSAGIYVLGNTMFLLLGTGNEMYWNKIENV